jgi:hypothetical protein
MAKIYSPEDVKLTFAGIEELSGWKSISITRNNDNFSPNPSADGVQAYTKIADKSGMMTISVPHTATKFHTAMAAYQALIDANPSKDVTVDASLIDPAGGNCTILDGIRLNKMADPSYEAEMTDSEYTFLIDNVYYAPVPEGYDETASEISNAYTFASTIAANAGL